MSKNILIVGASSGIAEAVARRYASEGCSFFLVGRSKAKLDVIAADLIARNASSVSVCEWAASNASSFASIATDAWTAMPRVDIALIAHGTLPDQGLAESDTMYALKHFEVNGSSAVGSMMALADRFAQQRSGVLAVIGSVAGDRGRQSNYLYGAAKAAVEACASGLRARLHKVGCHVLLIKPGFVATAMTANLNLPAALTVSPDVVARDIQRAIERKRDVIYTPWFWRWIMLIIRWIPGVVFKRLAL